MALSLPISRRPLPAPTRVSTTPREHDACGVAFVADLHGRRSHDVVAKGLAALCRLDHRGARGAEPNTGDGAGIMIQIPDAFLPRRRRLRAAAGRAVRHRPGLPPRRRRRRGPRPPGAGEVRAGRGGRRCSAGATCRSTPSDLGATALAALPRIRQVFLAAHRLTDSPAGPAGERADRARAGPGRVLRAQADRAGDRASAACRRTSRRCPAAPSSTRACSPPTSCRPFFPDLPDERVSQRHRAGALPLLHEHVPVLAAGAPVPVHRPQRRDQHDPRQPQLDGRPRGAAAPARTCRATSAGCSRSAPRPPPTRRTSTRCWSCCTWPGAACRTRC